MNTFEIALFFTYSRLINNCHCIVMILKTERENEGFLFANHSKYFRQTQS